MIAGSLVYDDSIDTSEIHQVLFIDSNVSEFKDYANTSTFPIIYDRSCTRDQMSEVLSRKFTSISRIAFVSHFSETSYFLTSGGSGVDVVDVVDVGVLPISELLFSESNTQFVIDVIKQFQVSNVDYLACNTLSSSAWTDYYSTIAGSTGVTIGASDNNTGNIKYGGDWILESTHEDVHAVYFNDLLQNYASLLATITINSITYTYVPGSGIASVTGGSIGIVSATILATFTDGGYTYSVTSIGNFAFNNCTILTSVTIPSSVTSIGSYAFYNCSSLSSVIFSPNSVLTNIFENAFQGCNALTAINFTNITTATATGWSIGNYTFNCTNLRCVVFGSKTPTSIGTSNFTATSPSAIAYSPSPTAVYININLVSTLSTIIVNPIAAPTSVTATPTSYGNASVTFTGVSAQPPITNYKYSVDGGNSWTLCSPVITTATPFTISGLASGTTYSVSIKATNFIGDGLASTASATSNITTTSSTTGPFSTIGTNSILGINNIPNLSVNTNSLAFHAPMGVYFTNPNLYAPTSQYFNFNSNKGFTFNSGNTRLVTIDNTGSLWCNGLSVIGGVGGGGNITCESNMFVLGKVLCNSGMTISSGGLSCTGKVIMGDGMGVKTFQHGFAMGEGTFAYVMNTNYSDGALYITRASDATAATATSIFTANNGILYWARGGTGWSYSSDKRLKKNIEYNPKTSARSRAVPTFSYKIRRLTRAIKASISAAILDTCEVKEAFCEVKLAISTPILETIETKEAFCEVKEVTSTLIAAF